jgi:hypothetical protein
MNIRVVAWSVIGLCTIGLVYAVWPESSISHPPGVLCPEIPVQTKPTRTTPWLRGEFMITPLADFSLHGLVLSRENYYSGRESDLSPVDFAIGWARMSDQSVVDRLDISQGGRWYKWSCDIFPIPRREIEQSSANMHIIPANEQVEDAIDEVVRGSVVSLSGYLVKVTSEGNWRWSSSTSRNDVGDGACELIWVESLQVEN